MDNLHSEEDLVLFKIYRLRYKILVILIILIIVFINALTIEYRKPQIVNKKSINYDKNVQCYTDRDFSEDLELIKIDDILINERKPMKGKSLFFHETSCSRTGQLKLNARQACAIESAALLNPNLDIFVLFASPVARAEKNESKIVLNMQEALKQYENIYLRNVNMWRYANGTPIYDWLNERHLFHSNNMADHVSDIMRFITLWRWGGTHLDLDIILKKSLESIKPNFSGAESNKYVACGVLNLDYNGFGHEIADMLLKRLQINFDTKVRSSIGPVLLTEVLQTICRTSQTKLMTRNRCSGFKVFDKDAFYAIGWANSEYFFDKNYLNISLSLTNESIAIHVWNRMSKDFVVKVGSKVAYGFYAEKYCPKVYSSCGEFF